MQGDKQPIQSACAQACLQYKFPAVNFKFRAKFEGEARGIKRVNDITVA